MLGKYQNLPTPVYILCIGTFINRAGTLLVPFLTLYVQEDLGLSVEFATYAMGAFGLGAIVASALGGHLADCLGRRVTMLIGLLGGAAVLLLFATLTWPPAILLASFGFALVAEMYRSAAAAMIADLVEPERRTHAFGLMYVATNLGFCIGPVVAGTLAEYSFKWLFWGDALTSSIYALLILVAIRETLPSARRIATHGKNTASRKLLTESGGASPGTDGDDLIALDAPNVKAVPLGQAFRRVLADRVFMVFSLATLLTALVFMQLMSTFPLYLQDFDIGKKTYGWLVAINGAMIVLLQLPVTSIVSRYPRGIMIALGSVFLGVGLGLVGVATAVWHFAVTIVIMTFGELMQAPLMQATVGDLAPVELRGRYMGVLGICFSGAMTIGAPIGGLVLANLGGSYVWAGCFVLAMVAALMYLCINNRISIQRPESDVGTGHVQDSGGEDTQCRS